MHFANLLPCAKFSGARCINANLDVAAAAATVQLQSQTTLAQEHCKTKSAIKNALIRLRLVSLNSFEFVFYVAGHFLLVPTSTAANSLEYPNRLEYH